MQLVSWSLFSIRNSGRFLLPISISVSWSRHSPCSWVWGGAIGLFCVHSPLLDYHECFYKNWVKLLVLYFSPLCFLHRQNVQKPLFRITYQYAGLNPSAVLANEIFYGVKYNDFSPMNNYWEYIIGPKIGSAAAAIFFNYFLLPIHQKWVRSRWLADNLKFW